MNTFILTLTAREPLVITDGSAESMAHQTLTHIPGNMLLGAFASAWIAAHPSGIPDDTPEFRALFLDGSVEWGPACPLVADTPTVPVPLCLMRDKNGPDLPCEGVESHDNNNVEIYNVLCAAPESQGGTKLKKLASGFMEPQSCCRPALQQLWTMHIALGDTRRALDGQLFGYAALAPKSRFQAEIRCHGPESEALRELLEKTPTVRVGHARSAGYGLVDCTVSTAPCTIQESTGTRHILFLHTPYVSLHSWMTPFESLRHELEQCCAETVQFTAIFATHELIQGFNSLWKKPRTARNVLTQGAVLVMETQNPVSLPSHLTLGADRREGYGRIECNPAWLAQPVLRPKAVPARPAKKPPQATMSPMLAVLRRRTIDRLAAKQATDWLALEGWRKFLQSVSKTKIRQSQRGNIRYMVMELPPETWKPRFLEAMEKTPGIQWKQAVAWSPLTKHNEHMNVLMADILDRETMLKAMESTPPELPGGTASGGETERFYTNTHSLLVLELLRAWEKSSRTNTNKEND